jgi:anti-sigma28 factor (negative regulator of flagellin synthesis)
MREATKQQKTLTFEQLKQTLAETPEVRQDLVERFRFLVETGRYNVSNLAIAETMLEDGVLDDELPIS